MARSSKRAVADTIGAIFEGGAEILNAAAPESREARTAAAAMSAMRKVAKAAAGPEPTPLVPVAIVSTTDPKHGRLFGPMDSNARAYLRDFGRKYTVPLAFDPATNTHTQTAAAAETKTASKTKR